MNPLPGILLSPETVGAFFCFSDFVRQILDKRYVIIRECRRVACKVLEVVPNSKVRLHLNRKIMKRVLQLV